MRKITDWTTLEGNLVRLVPLSMEHASPLRELIAKDRPDELWFYHSSFCHYIKTRY